MCQGQEKTKELLKTESQWDMTTECNMGYWIEFYNRKKIVVENWWNLSKFIV